LYEKKLKHERAVSLRQVKINWWVKMSISRNLSYIELATNRLKKWACNAFHCAEKFHTLGLVEAALPLDRRRNETSKQSRGNPGVVQNRLGVNF